MESLLITESKPKRRNIKRRNKKSLLIDAFQDYETIGILDKFYNYDDDETDNEYNINIDELIPRNENQRNYINYIKNKHIPIVFSIGSAGTGKTFIAIVEALREVFVYNNYKKILITRPVVTCSEDLGYLPGSYQDKLDPYLRPLYDIFLKYISKKNLKYYLDEEIIEICPLGFVRGRTFEKECIFICDEMQNSSPEQMKNLLTRLGDGAKLIITGDIRQSDLNKPNGLNDFINKYKNHSNKEELNSIKIIEFERKDIVRSKVIKTILNIYEDFD